MKQVNYVRQAVQGLVAKKSHWTARGKNGTSANRIVIGNERESWTVEISVS